MRPSSSSTPSRSLRSAGSRTGGVAHDRAVGLGHLEARVREAVGELAVVGEQDQPGGVGVEAPDRVEAAVGLDEVDDGRAAVGVVRGRDDARGLVEDVDRALVLGGADRLAVDRDRVAAVDVARRVADDLAADGHAPVEDQLLGGAARGDPGVGEVLGEPHGGATIGDAAMDLELLDRTLADAGEPAFRARQAWRWTAGGAAGYDEMTDLPGGAARRASRREVPYSTLTLADEAHARDGTVKALFHTHDGRPVEAVLMRYRDGRRSVCVSSQSGCPLTCTFCATGAMKFGRNLTASEILDQVLHFRRIEPLNHLVFMGMGEPMMNLDNVLGAARRLPDLGITHRRTGISTVGWAPGIRRLDRVRHADPARALPARARGRAALEDHAGQRALLDRRGARRVRGATTSAAAARSSSST